MDFSSLNESNFIMYAMKYYENPTCVGMDEFYEDLNRIKYVKRLFRKYEKSGILRERLILNHLIILGNVFGPIVTSRIMFYKTEPELHSYLKSFLVYLNYLPKELENIDLDSIPLDQDIVNHLRSV